LVVGKTDGFNGKNRKTVFRETRKTEKPKNLNVNVNVYPGFTGIYDFYTEKMFFFCILWGALTRSDGDGWAGKSKK
jgi:hypothetical protein